MIYKKKKKRKSFSKLSKDFLIKFKRILYIFKKKLFKFFNIFKIFKLYKFKRPKLIKYFRKSLFDFKLKIKNQIFNLVFNTIFKKFHFEYT